MSSIMVEVNRRLYMDEVTVITPAAFQGIFSGMDRKYKAPDMVAQRMENTCWVWRTDGPLMNQIKDVSE